MKTYWIARKKNKSIIVQWQWVFQLPKKLDSFFCMKNQMAHLSSSFSSANAKHDLFELQDE